MAMEQLTLESLTRFRGGMINDQVNDALRRCFDDIDQRGSLKTKRSVTIKLEFKPTDDVDETEISASVAIKIPAECLSRRVRKLRNKNSFGFFEDTDSVDADPRQETLPYGDDDDEPAARFADDEEEDWQE